MYERLLFTAAVLAFSTAAAAQPAGGLPIHGRLFISPSGEPFRGGGGLNAWLDGADPDHDAAVTLDEFRADAARYFKVLDANADGVIDGFEIQDYERRIVPEITQMGGGGGPAGEPRAEGRRGGGGGGHRGGGHGGGGHGGGGRRGGGGGGGGEGGTSTRSSQPPIVGREGAARFSLLNEPQPVAGADADLNGRVSAEEWAKAAKRRFELLDKTKAGRLTLEVLDPPKKG
jgi:hypothetical protein